MQSGHEQLYEHISRSVWFDCHHGFAANALFAQQLIHIGDEWCITYHGMVGGSGSEDGMEGYTRHVYAHRLDLLCGLPAEH